MKIIAVTMISLCVIITVLILVTTSHAEDFTAVSVQSVGSNGGSSDSGPLTNTQTALAEYAESVPVQSQTETETTAQTYTASSGHTVSASPVAEGGYSLTVFDDNGGSFGNILQNTLDFEKADKDVVSRFQNRLSYSQSYNPIAKTMGTQIQNADELTNYEYAYFALLSEGKTKGAMAIMKPEQLSTYVEGGRAIGESLKNSGREATVQQFDALDVMRYSALSEYQHNSSKTLSGSGKTWVVSEDKSRAVEIKSYTLAELKNAGYTEEQIVDMGYKGKGIKEWSGGIAWFDNLPQDKSVIKPFVKHTAIINGRTLETSIPGTRAEKYFTFDRGGSIFYSNDYESLRTIAEHSDSSIYNSDLLTVSWDNPKSHYDTSPRTAYVSGRETKYLDESYFRHHRIVNERGEHIAPEDMRPGMYIITTTSEPH